MPGVVECGHSRALERLGADGPDPAHADRRGWPETTTAVEAIARLDAEVALPQHPVVLRLGPDVAR